MALPLARTGKRRGVGASVGSKRTARGRRTPRTRRQIGKRMATSAEIRQRLATELRLDLIGPSHLERELVNEILPDPPSRWYLTGFLVPLDGAVRVKARQ